MKRATGGQWYPSILEVQLRHAGVPRQHGPTGKEVNALLLSPIRWDLAAQKLMHLPGVAGPKVPFINGLGGASEMCSTNNNGAGFVEA